MSWVRIDDQFPQHPKVVRAGPLGLALFVAGLCYCNRYLTDGVIPEQALNCLLSDTSSGTSSTTLSGNLESLAEKLVEVGLWDRVDDGFQIHDYLDYQRSRQEIQARKERSRIGGQRSAQVRVQVPLEVPLQPTVEVPLEVPVEELVNEHFNPSQLQPQHTTTKKKERKKKEAFNGNAKELIDLFTGDEYLELMKKYPPLEYDHEALAADCLAYHREHGNKIMDPKSRYRRWLKNEKKWEEENDNGGPKNDTPKANVPRIDYSQPTRRDDAGRPLPLV